MKTFDGFQVVFTDTLRDMRAIEQTSPQYDLLEQQLGRYCYEAEEQLPTTELRLLKGTLGISARTWQKYKAAFVASHPTLE